MPTFIVCICALVTLLAAWTADLDGPFNEPISSSYKDLFNAFLSAASNFFASLSPYEISKWSSLENTRLNKKIGAKKLFHN